MTDTTRSGFDRLFFPRRVGILGLSNRPTTWGRLTLERLRVSGFDGDIVAIAPRSPVEIPSVADFDELDEPLDLLIVAVPPAAAVDGIARARKAGTGSAVVLTAGFAETGPEGAELQQQLRAAAGDMPLVGPNCVGLVSRPGRLAASPTHYFDRPAPEPGPIAILTHSGGIGIVLANMLEQRGHSYRYYVSIGNEACSDIGSIGSYLLERDDVQVLSLYLESVRDPKALRELGRTAARLGKHVVALKTGMTEAGKRAAFSHTAAVAGDALLFRAACQEAGILVAADDEHFAETVLACAQATARTLGGSGRRTAVVTMSGGGGTLLADRLSAAGADVFEFGDKLADRIRELGFPGLAGATNPVDVGAQWKDSVEEYLQLLHILDTDPDVEAIVSYFAIADSAVESVRRIAGELARLATPARMVWTAAPRGALDGTPPGTVFSSVAAFTRHLAAQPGPVRPPHEGRSTAEPGSGTIAARDRLRAAVGPVLTEAAAHRVLAALDLPYAPTLVHDPDAGPFPDDALPAVADQYVVKADSPDAVHRARLGLVRLAVQAGEVPAVVAELAASARDQEVCRDLRIAVQPQLSHRGQIAVGAVRDELYGPALIVGPGGDRAEEAGADRYAVLLPAPDSALREIAATVARAFGPLDEEGLAELLTSVADLVSHTPELSELDINPVLVTEDGGLAAVDSLIRLV